MRRGQRTFRPDNKEDRQTDRDAVWGLTHVGPRNHVLRGRHPLWEVAILGVSGPLKSAGSLC